MSPKRIVIAGGSGFIGSVLAGEFSARGFEVAVLSRSPRRRTGLPPHPNPATKAGSPQGREEKIREVEWDAVHLGEWIAELDGAEAVINLCGRSINCPHTPENLELITASRVNSVKTLAAAIGHVNVPPRAWVQAGAIGFYGDTGEAARDENSPAGNDTLANICRQWEAACAAARVPQTRKVVLRIGFVLGRDGGALPILGKMTKWFLGGAAGSGRQYISWIHIADLAAMFVAVVTNEKLSGTFNAVSPNAVTNAQFMRALRRALHRPWSPPAPKFAVKFGAKLMGSDASLALAGQQCVPGRFLAAGFQFRFTEVASALNDLCR